MAKYIAANEREKEFLDIFNSLCETRSGWQVWTDLITAMAIALSNALEKNPDKKAERENEFNSCIEHLGGMEKPSELFAIIVTALEENPEQDFLGGLFMKLQLGSHWHGQFFTPYNVCELMSRINLDHIKETVGRNGYVTVNDCACGAGATLIAAANVMRENKVNYQNCALFVAQDVDRIAGLMCYIQLSLLGCAGYVVIANSLTSPTVGVDVLLPHEQKGQEFWYTPMYYRDIWHYRRVYKNIEKLFESEETQ